MPTPPEIRFLSLFVPDLKDAARRYQAMLGVAPSAGTAGVPSPHPFASAGPMVFELGAVKLALYQCDMQGTHPGDVGIGLQLDEPPQQLAQRARQQGGQPFFGPAPVLDERHQLVALMMPDRHFFEAVGPR